MYSVVPSRYIHILCLHIFIIRCMLYVYTIFNTVACDIQMLHVWNIEPTFYTGKSREPNEGKIRSKYTTHEASGIYTYIHIMCDQTLREYFWALTSGHRLRSSARWSDRESNVVHPVRNRVQLVPITVPISQLVYGLFMVQYMPHISSITSLWLIKQPQKIVHQIWQYPWRIPE